MVLLDIFLFNFSNHLLSLQNMQLDTWWFVQFGTICTILKKWKTPMEEQYF